VNVLLGHTFYRSTAPSGEDEVFRCERRLLEENGIRVTTFERHNDHIDDSTLSRRVRLGMGAAWSRKSYRELSALIRRVRPDVAHFHNTFPQMTPSVWAACRDNGVPVVQTLHNYRFVCPQAMLQREGRPCEECFGTTLLPALRNRCYRSSLPATLAQVWTLAMNRAMGSFNLVDRYLALTRFAAARLSAGGIPGERITVRSNFLDDPPPQGSGDGGYALFVGRLSPEKGLLTLLRAWERVRGLPLAIVGDGPLLPQLREMVSGMGLPVEFHGQLPRREVLRMIGDAVVQIVPSEWYEGFPMVVLEAYACGTPVIASRIGSLEEIVEEGGAGSLFETGNAEDLAATVNGMVGNPVRMDGMRRRAREYFLGRYSPASGIASLLEIYRGVIHEHRTRNAGGNPRLL
jgi:glycosyltransferase involved in cell wall biosynthesis